MYTTDVNVFNFELYRRYDKEIPLIFENNSVRVNFLGHTLSSEIWNKERSKKYCDFQVTVTNAANGELTLSLNSTQTTALPDFAYYDLKDNSGTQEKNLLTGTIKVSEGRTS